MVQLIIDGARREVPPAANLLSALAAIGIDLPSACHDPRLEVFGGCRLCLVHLNGAAKPVAACTVEPQAEMRVDTRSPELESERLGILRFLARRYPRTAVASDPELPFHRLLRRYGIERELSAEADPTLYDDSHPYLVVDMSRCIHCFRCVRICAEVQGQHVWRADGRGDHLRIVPDSGTTLAASSCVSCGACADTCPTGAISDRSVVEQGTPTSWTHSTCPYCGVGCETDLGVREGKLLQIRPPSIGGAPIPSTSLCMLPVGEPVGLSAVQPRRDAPVARGHLCVKGRYAFDFGAANDRVVRPRLRADLAAELATGATCGPAGGWREVSWNQAISTTARGFRDILDRYGPQSVGVLGSARATNEENFLTQKLARTVFATHNVDCCARVCHAPSAAGLARVFGTGAATNSFADIELARTIMVTGANSTASHPVVGARIRQAASRGAHLIVIDPRRTELAAVAEVHLQQRPGTNVPLLNALACAIFEQGLADRTFLAERASGLDVYEAATQHWTPERAAAICGVAAADIRRAALLYAGERPAMSFHGLGVTEHGQGTDGVVCLANLALLTGNVGRRGAGVNPLRGQNNVQGSANMGCEPQRLVGYTPIAAARQRTETRWGVRLPETPGLDWMQMVDAAAAGSLKALYVIGYDVLLSNPNAAVTRRALESLELLVVQDLFWNETAGFAHVFLPVATSFEKDGTFMNAERRVQRVRRAVEPPPEVLADWEVICRLAAAMGQGELFSYRGPGDIWDEVRELWPAAAGIDYDRLDQSGLQWPCNTHEDPGSEVLHGEQFALGSRAQLVAIDYRPSLETTTAELPFLLNTGRVLYEFNAGTMTGRTANRRLRPGDVLEVAPVDASRLGLVTGERVRLRSRWGETVIPIALSPALRPGELFATFHTPEVFLNRVTGPYRDSVTHTPEYKVTAVAIERL